MNPHLKALQDKLQSLITEAQTTTDPVRVEALPDDIKQAQLAIGHATKLAEQAAGANDFLNGANGIRSLASFTTAEGNELAAMDAAQKQQIASSIQFDGRAGTDLIGFDRNGRATGMDAEGWGISEKQFKAISEPAYSAAFSRHLRGKADSNDYRSVLTEGSDEGGGYLVPPEWLAQVIMRKPAPTRLLNYVNTIPSTRDKLIVPRVNYDSDTGDIYTSGVRISWTGEQGPAVDATDPVFGDVEVPIYTGLFGLEVNKNLLEDSPYAVNMILQDLAAQAYELGIENVVVNGTGAGQPTGFMLNPGASGMYPPSTNLGDPITADKLTSFIYAMPPQYMSDPERTIAIMNQISCFSTLAQIKDTSGQYIFGLARSNGPEGMATPRTPQLFGFNVILSAFMPNCATNNYPIAFGDLKSAYVVARRIGLSVIPYGDQDKSMIKANKVGWYFRFRLGGQVVQNRALHAGKQA